MPVNIAHPHYRGVEYGQQRACLAGEEAVRAEGETFLRMPSGTRALMKEDPAEARAAYDDYAFRAQFPELLGAALDGLAGLAHSKPWTVEVPDRLKPLLEVATLDGRSFDELAEDTTREVLLTGHHGLLVDAQDGFPYIAPYVGDAILNWAEVDSQATTIVLTEEHVEPTTADPYRMRPRTTYRVLRLDEKGYTVEEHRRRQGWEIDVATPSFQRGAIPFCIVGSSSRDLTPDRAIPLRPMARHLLTAYRVSADYYQAMHAVTQPTPVFTGIGDADPPALLGSAAAIGIGSPEAKAFYLETSGRGLDTMRTEIERQIELAMMHSHHVARTGRQTESGDSLRQRISSKTASLRSTVTHVERSLEQTLRYAAIWIGADPAKCRVEAPKEYADPSIDAALVTAYSKAQALGQIPTSVFARYLRSVRATTLDDAEFTAELRAMREAEEATAVGFAAEADVTTVGVGL